MQRCRRCQGWLPTPAACPNCRAAAPRAPAWLKGFGTAAGGAALGVALSACDGAETSASDTSHGSDDIPVIYNSAAYGNPVYDPNHERGPAAVGEGRADPLLGAEASPPHHHDGAGNVVPGLDPDDPDEAPCGCGAALPP